MEGIDKVPASPAESVKTATEAQPAPESGNSKGPAAEVKQASRAAQHPSEGKHFWSGWFGGDKEGVNDKAKDLSKTTGAEVVSEAEKITQEAAAANPTQEAASPSQPDSETTASTDGKIEPEGLNESPYARPEVVEDTPAENTIDAGAGVGQEAPTATESSTDAIPLEQTSQETPLAETSAEGQTPSAEPAQETTTDQPLESEAATADGPDAQTSTEATDQALPDPEVGPAPDPFAVSAESTPPAATENAISAEGADADTTPDTEAPTDLQADTEKSADLPRSEPEETAEEPNARSEEASHDISDNTEASSSIEEKLDEEAPQSDESASESPEEVKADEKENIPDEVSTEEETNLTSNEVAEVAGSMDGEDVDPETIQIDASADEEEKDKGFVGYEVHKADAKNEAREDEADNDDIDASADTAQEGEVTGLEGISQAKYEQVGKFLINTSKELGIEPEVLTKVPIEKFAIISNAVKIPDASNVIAAAADQMHGVGYEVSAADRRALEEPFEALFKKKADAFREKLSPDEKQLFDAMRDKAKQPA